ncbi:alpha/beta fold hydrolase [Streptomyces akebiae]|uniref:Alpha/beta hydrolase n=1 Tax=Streptomyces akebiae TaxID=2865673 RepID=A0ABX8XJF6_9ACTN|nr:alpha/beta hydrolase [Streptomyces akebiae]QYX75727.1 alpha/beta hydrolase [Streptomyces akebiae]
MPAVFVHGIPDTHHVWDDLFGHLTSTDVSAPALPGFGIPRPEGFTATKEEYVNWIIARLEEIGSPVDLVGHDWGSALTARVASLRPDLVRTWAGGDAAISPAFDWSPLSEIWQTPGLGEQWMAELDPSAFSTQLQGDGVPIRRADEIVSRMDDTMKDSMLRLVRSGVHTGAEWQPGLADITSPSLVFWGREDQYQPVEHAEALAKNVRATNLVLLDSGHWPHLQQPRELAAALTQHWESVPA